MKTCSRCGGVKPLVEFGKETRRPDGHSHECLPCHRARSAVYFAAHRDEVAAKQRARRHRMKVLLDSFKKPCPVCGESDPDCIDFHHRDPSLKEHDPSLLIHQSAETLLAEMAKCVPICANCHRKYHAGNAAVVAVVDGR